MSIENVEAKAQQYLHILGLVHLAPILMMVGLEVLKTKLHEQVPRLEIL